MREKFKNYVLWLGLLSGFVAAFIYLSMTNIEASDSLVYVELDHSTSMEATIETAASYIPTSTPTPTPTPAPTLTPRPCETRTELIENKPLIFVLCGIEVVGIPSATSYIKANNLQEAEALLAAYVQQLLGGISSSDKPAGYNSSFSDSSILNTLTLKANGHVSIDFNSTFKSKQSHLHHLGARLMLDQLHDTVFQFREVNSLAITLDGSCEDFAHLFEYICINTKRDHWQQGLDRNNKEVRLFWLQKKSDERRRQEEEHLRGCAE